MKTNKARVVSTLNVRGWLSTVLLTLPLLLAATGSAAATVRYVNVNNATPTAPYTNWATAAKDIQAAVNAAAAGDEIVVTNGVYTPVTVNTPLTLQSVNGPGVTIINGGGAQGCVYLADGAALAGFTLTNGNAGNYGSGGGVVCQSVSAVVSNCVLAGNTALPYGDGGGAYGGTLNNCTLTGNSAEFGGGAAECTLNNCALSGNSTGAGGEGGGAADCTLNNCTLTGNSASGDGASGG